MIEACGAHRCARNGENGALMCPIGPIHFKRPVEFAHLSHDEWTTLLKDRVEAVETIAAAERQANKRQVLGRKAVLRRSPFSCPSSSPPRRNSGPTVAAGSKKVRIAALDAMKYFRHRYYQALEERTVQLINGGAEVLFPRGTYQLARLGLVRCEPAPS